MRSRVSARQRRREKKRRGKKKEKRVSDAKKNRVFGDFFPQPRIKISLSAVGRSLTFGRIAFNLYAQSERNSDKAMPKHAGNIRQDY